LYLKEYNRRTARTDAPPPYGGGASVRAADQGRSQGVARVAKSPIPTKKKLSGKNNWFYLQHLHCTLHV